MLGTVLREWDFGMGLIVGGVTFAHGYLIGLAALMLLVCVKHVLIGYRQAARGF